MSSAHKHSHKNEQSRSVKIICAIPSLQNHLLAKCQTVYIKFRGSYAIATNTCTQAEIDRKFCCRFEAVFYFRFRKKPFFFYSEFEGKKSVLLTIPHSSQVNFVKGESKESLQSFVQPKLMTERIAKGFLAIVLRGEYQQVEPFADQSVGQELK